MNTLNNGVENKTKCCIKKRAGLVPGLLEEGLLDSTGKLSSAARSSILRVILVGSSTLGCNAGFCLIKSLMFKVNSPNSGKACLGTGGHLEGRILPRWARKCHELPGW